MTFVSLNLFKRQSPTLLTSELEKLPHFYGEDNTERVFGFCSFSILFLPFRSFFSLSLIYILYYSLFTYIGWTQTVYLNKHYNINQKDEDT
jgi:hypothetical protein